jgi:tetrahydromethanopterin S-methyltransferase subunit G
MSGGVSLEIFEWVVGGMFSVLVAVGGFFFKQIASRLTAIERDLSRRNERISVLETHIDTVNRRLDRIETKLDILIEKKLNP